MSRHRRSAKHVENGAEMLQSKLNDINAFSLSEAAKDDSSVRTVKPQANSDKYLMKSKRIQNQSETKLYNSWDMESSQGVETQYLWKSAHFGKKNMILKIEPLG